MTPRNPPKTRQPKSLGARLGDGNQNGMMRCEQGGPREFPSWNSPVASGYLYRQSSATPTCWSLIEGCSLVPSDAQQSTERGFVIRQKVITRLMVQADRSIYFMFGDNLQRRGMKGQAAACRGEINAIGVPTKRSPGYMPDDYLSNADWLDYSIRKQIEEPFDRMEQALAEGRCVVIPADGLGTGLAMLPTKAPRIFAYIKGRIKLLMGVG